MESCITFAVVEGLWIFRVKFHRIIQCAETQHKNILTKVAISRALHYAVNQLPLIGLFFEDGRIHLAKNAI